MPHDAESAARHDLAVLAAYAASRAPTQPAPDPDFAGPSAKLPVSAFTQQAPLCRVCGDRGYVVAEHGSRRPCPNYDDPQDCPMRGEWEDHCAELGNDEGSEREI